MRIPAALLVSSLLALGACATPEQAAKMPVLPSEHYAIEVTPAPQELKLAPHADGLSNNQADALNAFVHDWMIAQGGEITLKAPEHGDSPDGAYRTVTAARDFLVAQGVAGARIQTVSYGKERPIDAGSNDDAWSRNRNAGTVVVDLAPR